MDIRAFLAELKGRGVYRVAAIYAAGSWALLQIADIFFPILGFPDWTITAVLAAAALGFPITIILAWLFDITPQGIVETDLERGNYGRLRLSPARLVELTLLLALVFLVGFLYFVRLTPTEQAGLDREAHAGKVSSRPSIAVLPFTNMSDAREVEYFGDGLAEEILNLLAKLNELDVSARTSSFYFKGRDVAVQEIGRHLGVEHILEGSVRRQGDKVRVTAQLVKADNGFHLWSETYDRDFRDSFLIQDQIAREVVDVLQVILSDSSREILDETPILDPVAYDYYLRGREYLRGPVSLEGLDRAIDLFSKALELDPGYAEAFAGLCDSYLGKYGLERDPAHFSAAEAACQKVLSLGGHNPATHVALGNLYRTSGEYGLAIAEFENALELNPSSADAYDGLGRTYQADNKPRLAEEAYLKAIQLQENNWRGYMSMGAFLFKAGRYEKAIAYYRRITELVPENAAAFNGLGAAYYMLSQFEPAAAAFSKSLKLRPNTLAYSNAGTSLFFLGRFDEAAEMYLKAVESAPEDHQNWGSLGDAYRYSADHSELAEPMYINAIKLAEKFLEVNPSAANTLALVAHYYAGIGNREEALKYAARATALGSENVYVHYNTATALCALGDMEEAGAALERAIELGYSLRVAQMDASLCKLAERPQFHRAMHLE